MKSEAFFCAVLFLFTCGKRANSNKFGRVCPAVNISDFVAFANLNYRCYIAERLGLSFGADSYCKDSDDDL